MYEVGDRVRIIDPFSPYYRKEAKIVAICGTRRIYYHLEIDGEKGEWRETQFMLISLERRK